MKKRILYIVAGLLLIAFVYGLREYFRPHNDLSGETPVAQMNMQLLIEAFEKDSLNSSRSYVNKVLAVNGKIRSVQSEEDPVIITLGGEGTMSSVQCSMDPRHAVGYRNLAAGNQVTLKGLCTGAITQELLGTDVQLIRCVVEEK